MRIILTDWQKKWFKILAIVIPISICAIVLPLSLKPAEVITDTPPEKAYYFAKEDVWFTKYGSVPDYYFNNMRPDDVKVRVCGGDDGTANPGYDVIYIRFDLNSRPADWTKCEISLYKYYSYRMQPTFAPIIYADLFEGDWNETNGNTQVFWKLDKLFQLNYIVGFFRYNITSLIMGNTSVSLRLYASTMGYQGQISLYSRTWNGGEPYLPFEIEGDEYKAYLPQIRWN